MDIGKLRHRAQLRSRVESARNVDGGIAESRSTLSTVWARFEPLTGRELFQAQQVQSRATTRITIRGYSGLTSKNQVRRIINSGGVTTVQATYEILHVGDLEERGITMQILAVEVA